MFHTAKKSFGDTGKKVPQGTKDANPNKNSQCVINHKAAGTHGGSSERQRNYHA